jgi:site-specific DNA-methyltransferase (adenine-specific)
MLTSPYFSDELTDIYNGDTNHVLGHLPSCDLLIADPPYHMWGQFVDSIKAHNAKTIVAYTSWQHRHILDNAFGKPRTEFIWHFKDGRWVSHNLPRNNHASILVYGETREAYVGEVIEDRTPKNKGYGSVGKYKYQERIYVPRERKILDSVITAPRNLNTGVWTKPKAVIQPFIEWLCPPGGLVIDAFAGAGTSLEISRSLNLKNIGIEQSEDCCIQIAKKLSR